MRRAGRKSDEGGQGLEGRVMRVARGWKVEESGGLLQ